MISISREEIAKAVFYAFLLKGVGPNGIPAIVWQKLWPITQDKVVSLFIVPIKLGVMPKEWKTVKIIPLRKLQKPDYTIAEVYCLI